MNVDILYVDGREYNNRNTAEKVRLVPFRFDIDKDATPISLLYRCVFFLLLKIKLISIKGLDIMISWLGNIMNKR